MKGGGEGGQIDPLLPQEKLPSKHPALLGLIIMEKRFATLSLRNEQTYRVKTKNKKLRRLIELKQPLPQDNQVLIVNLTKYVLSAVERPQLDLGLE